MNNVHIPQIWFWMAEHEKANSIEFLFIAKSSAWEILGVGPVFGEVDFETTSILDVVVDLELNMRWKSIPLNWSIKCVSSSTFWNCVSKFDSMWKFNSISNCCICNWHVFVYVAKRVVRIKLFLSFTISLLLSSSIWILSTWNLH